MIERHWDGIAAYCQPANKVSLGFVEGLNKGAVGLGRIGGRRAGDGEGFQGRKGGPAGCWSGGFQPGDGQLDPDIRPVTHITAGQNDPELMDATGAMCWRHGELRCELFVDLNFKKAEVSFVDVKSRRWLKFRC